MQFRVSELNTPCYRYVPQIIQGIPVSFQACAFIEVHWPLLSRRSKSSKPPSDKAPNPNELATTSVGRSAACNNKMVGGRGSCRCNGTIWTPKYVE